MKTLANLDRMKSVQTNSVLSGALRTGALTLFLAFTFASVGCNCPPPVRSPAAIADSPQHREAADTLLRTATAKQTWTDGDERAFHRNLSHLSGETRLALAKQLSSLVTSGKVTIKHNPSADLPPPVCQCLTAPCTPATGGTPAGDTPPVIQVAPRAAEPTPANSRKKQN